MSTPTDTGEPELFESLSRHVDPEKLAAQDKEAQDRFNAQAKRAQERLGELIGENSTLPVTINSISFIGGRNTRRTFLDRLFNPLLSTNRDHPYTLAEALNKVSSTATKLRRFEIFHEPISTFISRPDPTNPTSTPSDIDIYIHARERGRVLVKSGTDVGNVEGSAYANVKLRNLFGGAESLDLYASMGTRTRSAYQAIFDTPILSDPDRRVTIDALSSTTSKFWASHEEVLNGGGIKYSWATDSGTRHKLGYTGVWRQITGLASNASPIVRNDAGDSVKSSITHEWISDARNHPFLPTSGYLLKTVSEIAGWGPLQGDVAFWKSEMETSGALSVPIPGVRGDSGVSLTGSLRAGFLYPLPVGFGSKSEPSRLNDRFQLGGPTDVRGFATSGLGPHDGQDAVGGDIYAAAATNLLVPFPRVGKDSPLRLQVFANAGRLLALNDREGKGRVENNKDAQKDFYGTLAQLGDGIPSLSAGVGVVYAHPVARFELNFGLPLVVRKGEVGRKGLQFGVGISFM